LATAQATLDGREGFIWRTEEAGSSGVEAAFQGETYIYVVGFRVPLGDPEAMTRIIESFTTGGNGDTTLPINLTDLGTAALPISACTNCNETDSYANSYGCCSTKGNCTWKAERDRSGANNFSFSGSNRDAYRWMTLARQYTSYAQGGTIPTIGSVLVAIDDYGGLGHVGTVTAINSNGSIVLSEQNCGATCSRTQTYATSWLLRYIAGYIYPGSTAPTVTARTVGTSGETVIEDYNFSNVYNFGTFGPGSFMSFNANERAWGTSTEGLSGCLHWVLSKTGSSENYGQWRAATQAAGLYEIQAWIPNSTSAAAISIKYELGGVQSSPINQSTNHNRWVQIRYPLRSDGYWNLAAGSYSVYLRDNANGSANQRIAFDAIKFIRR
jgi:surface antigen